MIDDEMFLAYDNGRWMVSPFVDDAEVFLQYIHVENEQISTSISEQLVMQMTGAI